MQCAARRGLQRRLTRHDPLDGSAMVAGWSEGEVGFRAISIALANAYVNGIVLVLEPDGSPRWATPLSEVEATCQVLPKRIAFDAAGDVVVAGSVSGAVTCADGTLRPHDFSQAFLACAFVARLDGQGRTVWLRAFDVDGLEVVHGLAVDPSGERIVVTGSFWNEVDFGGGALVSRGREDVYVFELDEAGRHRWSAAFGGGGDDVGRARVRRRHQLELAGATLHSEEPAIFLTAFSAR